MNYSIQKSISDCINSEKQIAVADSEGTFVHVTDSAAEIYGFTPDEMMGKPGISIYLGDNFQCGLMWQQIVNGNLGGAEFDILRGDGYPATIKIDCESITVDEEKFVKSEVELVELHDDDTDYQNERTDPDDFPELTGKELENITSNVRIEAPSGEIPLAAIMMDLAETHNDLQQMKHGALTLYQCLDERLAEERKKCPDSDVCAVLESVKDSAYGVYLRVQRGDEELHGDRDGEYSGYFE